ncbi:hypothetical protein [Aestuariibaculum suncheonense]|uniref:Lipoprotein n=1 Tax=Aestuariibaculum suncheonense TaxID=1028745 RepID=A0A8J6UAD2_9FLAO|nr:hypothetical protein [Aestuariibaculum suncheonense]MBD0834735.1 hypothetical protein [Aestuariibaculum suncheonense]
MRPLVFVFSTFLFMSCGKQKSVSLSEVHHSKLSEISDVSAAYLFYDISQKDSVELNRKSLISTTNWLINVDKRLTLKQVVPHLQFLQKKKKNASHKNKNSRNYFTCNNTSKKSLGLIDFTDVVFTVTNNEPIKVLLEQQPVNTKFIFFSDTGDIFIITPDVSPFIKQTTKERLIKDMKASFPSGSSISLRFSSRLSFQDYISIKSTLENISRENLKIDLEEFIQD